MKTINHNGKIRRVHDDEAFKLVEQNNAVYVSKSRYKSISRDVVAKKEKISEDPNIDLVNAEENPEVGITITEIKTKKEKKSKKTK